MKHISLVLILILFSACSFTGNSNRHFTANVCVQDQSNILRKIYIKHIKDLRETPNFIGSFVKNGENYQIISYDNFSSWIYKELERELKRYGYDVVNTPTRDSLRVKIHILKLNSHYENENLKGDLLVNINVQKGNIAEEENIKVSFNYFLSSAPSEEEYEEYAYEMLNSALDKIFRKIISS